MADQPGKKRRVFGKKNPEKSPSEQDQPKRRLEDQETMMFSPGQGPADEEKTVLTGDKDQTPPRRDAPPSDSQENSEYPTTPLTPSASSASSGKVRIADSSPSHEAGQGFPSSSSSATAAVPPSIKGYKLLERIGAGTFGSVWRARHLRTHADVAVKLFDRRIGADWDYLRREIECLLQVGKHPNIVTLLDADFFQDPPFYSMELMGASLEGEIRKYHKKLFEGKSREEREAVEFIPWPDAEQGVRWFEEMCRGLAYVHSKAFIHCDLKPGNVLVDDENRVRIVDFGQALLTGRNKVSLGTLFYMPPEQTEIEQGEVFHPSVQWDIYGLGATIYTLLTGRPPRSGRAQMRSLSTAGSVKEKLELYRVQLASTPLVPPSRCNSRISPEFSAIVDKCLEINPEHRYSSMSEVIDDIERMKNNQPMLCYQPWSRGYLAKKFIRRNALWLIPMAAILFVLIISQFYVFKQYQQQDWAVLTMYRKDGTFQDVEVRENRGLGYALDKAQETRYRETLEKAQDAALIGKGDIAAEYLDETPDNVRSWEYGRLLYLATQNPREGAPPPDLGVEKIYNLPEQIPLVRLSPNGFLLVVNYPYGRAEAINTRNGEVHDSYLYQGQGFRSLSIGPDSKTAAGLTEDGEIYIRKGPQWREFELLGVHPTAKAVALTPDLARVASVDGSGTIKIWIIATGGEIFEITDGPLETVLMEFSESGTKLILYDGNGTATLYQAASY